MTPASRNDIVWLASYPRSGNTWLRIFLAQLLSGDGKAADINALRGKLGETAIASSREFFDEVAGIDSSDLSPDEIDRLRPRVYEALATTTEKTAYVKVHDAYLLTPAGEPLMPASATRAAVYIVRNPLDIAVSLAFFGGHQNFDRTIAQMADPNRALEFGPGRLFEQLRQRLSTWSGHVISWIDAAGIKCHLMRYEDMVRSPLETFTAMIRFLDLPYDDAAIEAAIEGARFDNLRQSEELHGFFEKPAKALKFFRAGRVGDWRDQLSATQAAKVVTDHGNVMERLGYLNPDGSPKF